MCTGTLCRKFRVHRVPHEKFKWLHGIIRNKRNASGSRCSAELSSIGSSSIGCCHNTIPSLLYSPAGSFSVFSVADCTSLMLVASAGKHEKLHIIILNIIAIHCSMWQNRCIRKLLPNFFGSAFAPSNRFNSLGAQRKCPSLVNNRPSIKKFSPLYWHWARWVHEKLLKCFANLRSLFLGRSSIFPRFLCVLAFGCICARFPGQSKMHIEYTSNQLFSNFSWRSQTLINVMYRHVRLSENHTPSDVRLTRRIRLAEALFVSAECWEDSISHKPTAKLWKSHRLPRRTFAYAANESLRSCKLPKLAAIGLCATAYNR